MTQPTFLTLGEVADRLRVTTQTVRKLIHGGQLPAIRVGSQWRIAESEYDAYIARAATKVSA